MTDTTLTAARTFATMVRQLKKAGHALPAPYQLADIIATALSNEHATHEGETFTQVAYLLSPQYHVDCQGQFCPACGASNPEGQEVNIEDGKALQRMSCTVCDSEWTDVYTLTGLRGLTSPQ